LLTKAIIYLTQRISLVNIQKSKLFIKASGKFDAVSLPVCETSVVCIKVWKRRLRQTISV